MTKIDQIDARILTVLQKDNQLTSEQLSNAVCLSPTAVQRRLKRLRRERIIEGDVSIVSPKAVGRPITMLVSISLERERVEIIDNFKASVRSNPEVMSGYYVTGDADFILLITAKNMEEYEQFTRRFFYNNPDIKGFKTLVVIDRIKSGFSIPIEATTSQAPSEC